MVNALLADGNAHQQEGEVVTERHITMAENLNRQIKFWLGEARTTLYTDQAYSVECLEEAKKAADALTVVGEKDGVGGSG